MLHHNIKLICSIFLLGISLSMAFVHLSSCNSKPKNMNANIDIQGHRGCRGLRPENTIIAFKKAIEMGANTMELDVVANKFNDVIVSHEPFFNHEISTGPNGEEITEENEKDFNMYEMTVEEIQSYDVGMKAHPRFPDQKKMPAIKPTLKEMVVAVDAFAKEEGYDLPDYNIEVKRVKTNDNIFHPEVETFAEAVCQDVISLDIVERATVQSFDMETLQYIHKKYPNIKLILLIQDMEPFERNIAKLGFKPWGYSPYFKLVSEDLIKYGQKEDIKITPWTVNEEEDILNMMKLGVDGIISDYPDRVVELVKANQ